MTGLDLAGLMEENNRLSASSGGDSNWMEKFVKFPEGNGVVVVRLLGPATGGMFNRAKSPFFQATRTHRVNGKSLHCLRELQGNKFVGECPICQYYSWLWKQSESKSPAEAKALQAQARAIKPVERYYYNCIVRKEIDDKGVTHENVGPKILSIGKTLHKMIIAAILGDETMQEKPLGDVTDIMTGRDFKIAKEMVASGDDLFPNYNKSKFLDPSPLGSQDQVKLWTETLHDLVALRTLRPADDMKIELKKHLGLIPNESEDGFNAAEYQNGAADEDVAATRTQVAVKENVPTATATVVAQSAVEKVAAEAAGLTDGIDSGLDPSFLDTLRNIGG